MVFRFALGLLAVWSVCGCREAKVKAAFRPNTGQIQILNGCGISEAGDRMRDHLTQLGFDVVEVANASAWNFSRTLVIGRTDDWKVPRDLARVLGTKNLIQLKDSTCLVEASIIVGEDYYQLIP